MTTLTDEQYREVYRARSRSSLEIEAQILASRIACHERQLRLVQDVLAEGVPDRVDA